MKKIIKEWKRLRKIFKKNKLKKVLLIIVKSNTSPRQIATGAAIGAGLSIIPTFTLGMFAALFIAWKKNLNLLSTYLGSLAVTPITSSFVYYINYKVGRFVSGSETTVALPIEMHDIKFIVKEIYFGGLINGITFSIIIYLLLYFGVLRYRRGKKPKISF